MTRRRWTATVVALVGVIWGLGGEWVSITHGVQENHLLDAAVGLSWFVGGAVALDRRPGNIVGPLMVGIGFSWFCGNWSNAANPWALPLLSLVGAASTGLIAHLVVTYPTGRTWSRFERLVVTAAYVLPVAGMALTLVTTRGHTCLWCPPPSGEVAGGLARLSYAVYDDCAWVLVPLFFAVLWLRWRRSSPAGRRELAPLWTVAAVLAAVFSLQPFTSSESTGIDYLVWEINSLLQISVPWIFVYGLLSRRLAQSAVGALVVELQSPLAPGELRTLLARTLSDPSLAVAYPVAAGLWVDNEGRPVAVDPVPGRTGTTMVEHDGRSLAALVHDPSLDPSLVRATAAAAGMALDNERLQAELRAQLTEVRASRARIVRAGDAERRRVERDLHDGAQQRLLALSLAVHSARRQHASGDDAGLASTLERTATELASAIQELRELARGLHPTVLTDGGLPPALHALAGRCPVPVQLDVDEGRYHPLIEATAYFMVSEALANVAKHAHASHVRVEARAVGRMLRVEVCDDGSGGADPARGSGLAGLGDRVAAIGGSLEVESAAGSGTIVRADLPCGDAS